MKLHLLRHGKTEVISNSGKDFDRKLVEKGLKQAFLIGEYFNSIELKPTVIFCSDATRTRQTYSQIKKIKEFGTIKYLHDLYLAELNVLLDFMWNLENEEEVLIIGHNNGLSELANYFTEEFIDLRTCEYICISFDIQSWKESSKGIGVIHDCFHPKVSI